MKKNLLKRMGMLAVSAAVCYGGIFGALSLRGLQYVKLTAETWRVLPYVQPAARIEQETEYRAKNDGRQRFGLVRVTGYDEQDRPIWQYRVDPFLTDEEHWTYTGNTSEWRITNYGGRRLITQEYDAQNREIRVETSDADTWVYHYRGEETIPYLTERYNQQGELREQEVTEVDADGNRIDYITYFGDAEGTTARRFRDSHGNVWSFEEKNADDKSYTTGSGAEWTYDDEARTAVCRFPDYDEGMMEYRYDEQGRTIALTDIDRDGNKTTYTSVFTDVTR